MVTVFLYSQESVIGHMAIQIGTTYISWFGTDPLSYSFHPLIMTAHSMTMDREMDKRIFEAEKYPPRTIVIRDLNEKAMLAWWRKNHRRLYRTVRWNCCTVVAHLLHAGVDGRGWGRDYWPALFWSPAQTMIYAKEVQLKRKRSIECIPRNAHGYVRGRLPLPK